MPQQVLNSVENNFTKGLITEFTGLNFPENAATVSDNTEYTIIGDVIRREGIDTEVNGITNTVDRTNKAISSYKWNNASGDGLTQIVVEQVGNTLYFYKSSSTTTTLPLSTQLLTSTISLTVFTASGGTLDSTLECQYADGNGYLFVYHPSCDPFYCTYNAGVIVGNVITIQTRDFTGLPEVNLPVNSRPPALSDPHFYNLQNQGWQSAKLWSTNSSTLIPLNSSGQFYTVPLTTTIFGVQAGLVGVVNGQFVYINGAFVFQHITGYLYTVACNIFAQVTGYSGTTLTVTVLNAVLGANVPVAQYTPVSANWPSIAVSATANQITTWFSAVGNYPSNADVWWIYKNSSGVFAPATTINNFPPPTTPAAKGYFILNEFQQSRAITSSITTLTDVTTTVRPRTGTWFQGRVWFTGCDATVSATGNAPAYSWTENIYFSQIIRDVSQFGMCYQTNDPTSETLFDLLPSDGGVIKIQGCGSIYKLFPLQNALLVFAANGVWYIIGSQGLGFSASDFTIVKLSCVRSISSTSFVDIQGLPMFWNEEGIYQVEPAKQGTSLLSSPLHVNPLEVTPITLGTILSFYNDIPLSSKVHVHGAYNPIDYVVQWVYRDSEGTDITSRYTYNKILNYNTSNKAFFPYTINTSNPALPSINGIVYVANPGGPNTLPSSIKYISSLSNAVTFADEHDATFKDWVSAGGNNYISTFTTGYKLHGQGTRRSQIPYIYVYSRLGQPVAYYIQSLWDYPANPDSGRWSVQQIANINNPNFIMGFKRHRLRGYGLVLQIKITSVDGQPFDLMGWSLYEVANQGV